MFQVPVTNDFFVRSSVILEFIRFTSLVLLVVWHWKLWMSICNK